mmetsp:Transcript_74126/g.141088  ORF Transcript_74126/g.141088 Transcript_74126/m.141088 type:complete len:287 (+) Transcript_74126:126-986(+)
MFVILWSAARGRGNHKRRKAKPRGPTETELAVADARLRRELRNVRRAWSAQAVARNRNLPRLAGALLQTTYGTLGTSEHLRWVVLEPDQATLSIFTRPPARDVQASRIPAESANVNAEREMCAICLETFGGVDRVSVRLRHCGHVFHRSCLEQWTKESSLTRSSGQSSAVAALPTCPSCRAPFSPAAAVSLDLLPATMSLEKFSNKACKRSSWVPSRASDRPRRVFSLAKIEEVTSNSHFRNIFLRFEGESTVLNLTAHCDHECRRWLDFFSMYDPGSELPLRVRE